ncbi:MAG: hypothetical protein LBH22_07675 [Bacteroidales bacterium]|jgi:hypothetical protein|nr:hypothetical protein [Bacteroidales bacterium]
MSNITLISTTHKEIGKCNSDELLKIIEEIRPDVIFLEAFESNYTYYDHFLFSTYGVFNKKLEMEAIQKYYQINSFKCMIPVLDTELSDDFSKWLNIVCEYSNCQKLIDISISLVTEYGFQFLNSEKSIQLYEEIRELGNHILGNNEVCQKFNENIDAYENSMLRNIYAYSKENMFNKAIFMCGAAHRKSIIEKIEKYKKQENLKLDWTFYGN